MPPFLTLYTPTYRRPQGLARCLESVRAQTIADQIEHLVIPDHVGVGIAGMYQRIPNYLDAVHGQYVHVLADDDELASPDVVERVKAHAVEHNYPPVILVRVVKGPWALPQAGEIWPPVCGSIDLGCIITRVDVWKAFAGSYGSRYEGDFDFMDAVARAGYPATFCDVLFLQGGISHGAPEVAA
jgi:hypothetical protein